MSKATDLTKEYASLLENANLDENVSTEMVAEVLQCSKQAAPVLRDKYAIHVLTKYKASQSKQAVEKFTDFSDLREDLILLTENAKRNHTIKYSESDEAKLWTGCKAIKHTNGQINTPTGQVVHEDCDCGALQHNESINKIALKLKTALKL